MHELRVLSGGQTGVDRAALDAAALVGIPYGGWVPKGRLDEDGVIPPKYANLQEADSPEPEQRTELNVRDSDATLILSHGDLFGGSKVTFEKAIELRKPHLHLNLDILSEDEAVTQLKAWISEIQPHVLNVAGPRKRDDGTIYLRAKTILTRVLSSLNAMTDSTPHADDDLTVALALRDAALADYRHWDLIRWQVPYWYCTLATGTAAIATFTADKKYELSVRLGCGALAFFGLLCIGLLVNLIRYDAATIRRFNALLNDLKISDTHRLTLAIERAFSFSFPEMFATASLYFLLYIGVLTVAFAVTAMCGMWWT